MQLVAIWSAIISLLAFAVSIYAICQNKKDTFQTVASLIISQKNFFLDVYSRHHKSYETDENSKFLIDEAASNYYNSLEGACGLYLKNGLDKNLFETMFKEEISTLEEGLGIASFINRNEVEGDTYSSILKVSKIISSRKMRIGV